MKTESFALVPLISESASGPIDKETSFTQKVAAINKRNHTLAPYLVTRYGQNEVALSDGTQESLPSIEAT